FGFKPWYVSLVRNSPSLQDVAFGFLDYRSASNDITHFLIGSCSEDLLHSLDLRHGHLSMYVPLRRLGVPITSMGWYQLRYVVKHGVLQSFESLSMQMRDLMIGEGREHLTTKDVPPVLAAFPRLRELDLGSFRVFVEERTEDEQRRCLQDEEELDLMATVTCKWECRLEFRE
ncbi:hypothetical protein BGZ52_007342, partial [Haplosporangium bisporale]